jgi:hypothetical protein
MDNTLDYNPKRPKREKLPPMPHALRRFRTISFAALFLLASIALLDLWNRRIDPYGGYGSLEADLLLAVALILFPSALFAIWLFRFWRYAESRHARLQAASFCVAALVIIIGTITLNEAEVPFHVAFALSRPALERAIAELRADPTKTLNGKTIGLFPIEGVRIDGSQTSIFIAGAGFDITHALIYTTTAPAATSEIELLGNNWHFTKSFTPP